MDLVDKYDLQRRIKVGDLMWSKIAGLTYKVIKIIEDDTVIVKACIPLAKNYTVCAKKFVRNSDLNSNIRWIYQAID